jgi:hypothetical protein
MREHVEIRNSARRFDSVMFTAGILSQTTAQEALPHVKDIRRH